MSVIKGVLTFFGMFVLLYFLILVLITLVNMEIPTSLSEGWKIFITIFCTIMGLFLTIGIEMDRKE